MVPLDVPCSFASGTSRTEAPWSTVQMPSFVSTSSWPFFFWPTSCNSSPGFPENTGAASLMVRLAARSVFPPRKSCGIMAVTATATATVAPITAIQPKRLGCLLCSCWVMAALRESPSSCDGYVASFRRVRRSSIVIVICLLYRSSHTANASCRGLHRCGTERCVH